jgi:hypothetical protein
MTCGISYCMASLIGALLFLKIGLAGMVSLWRVERNWPSRSASCLEAENGITGSRQRQTREGYTGEQGGKSENVG